MKKEMKSICALGAVTMGMNYWFFEYYAAAVIMLGMGIYCLVKRVPASLRKEMMKRALLLFVTTASTLLFLEPKLIQSGFMFPYFVLSVGWGSVLDSMDQTSLQRSLQKSALFILLILLIINWNHPFLITQLHPLFHSSSVLGNSILMIALFLPFTLSLDYFKSINMFLFHKKISLHFLQNVLK